MMGDRSLCTSDGMDGIGRRGGLVRDFSVLMSRAGGCARIAVGITHAIQMASRLCGTSIMVLINERVFFSPE
jgi:hypothetical protein